MLGDAGGCWKMLKDAGRNLETVGGAQRSAVSQKLGFKSSYLIFVRWCGMNHTIVIKAPSGDHKSKRIGL